MTGIYVGLIILFVGYYACLKFENWAKKDREKPRK